MKRRIELRKKSVATMTVSRVRFRSTMCVPPCDAGEKPMPPKPVSRPECMRIRPIRPDASTTWMTARSPVTATRVAEVSHDDARERVQKLLVSGDNRLKQGVAPEKVRETYEQALAAAREAGLEDTVRPLVELRLADLEKLAGS